MWQILQQDKAEDFVLATGETHTVREFTEVAFNELGIELEWQGENENEKGIVSSIKNEKRQIIKEKIEQPVILTGVEESLNVGDTVVSINPKYYRPTEVDLLIGDATKAKETFGWEAKTKFDKLSRMMAGEDFKKVLKRGF